MTRRSFIKSTLQTLALVGAVKLGLGNMTAEDVRVLPEHNTHEVYDASMRIYKGYSTDGVNYIAVSHQGFVTGDLVVVNGVVNGMLTI